MDMTGVDYWRCELRLSVSGLGPMSPSFKHCNEALGFVKDRVLVDQLSN